ncbi:MAG: UvrD-helicase domain-containing protein [Spirochaetaceae bacterium]|jgi:DNA helicase-2/ATP-dependent DNA helicase PcrA|nr:UvrD-helicase domain-containing protein [Spirochaetaceae bacterium]
MNTHNFHADLNGPQKQAVTTTEGPLLIIAGAGSGKTRVITYRIAFMLEQGIPQSAILALTFTNKAAREMEIRVKELTGKKLQNLTVSTFHAFGVKLLRKEIEALGYTPNFSIYDETDRTELIKECLRECALPTEKADIYSAGQLFSQVKVNKAPWDTEIRFKRVFELYQSSLHLYNALDFDDLLVLPLLLFEQFPTVKQRYRERYRYLMIDEFQDTSHIQYQLMRTLANRNVCVVGDDDQSIYSWRGANYENILRFEQDFPGALEIKLEQNYRSSTSILAAANGVIAHNTNRKIKTLWSGNGEGKPIAVFYPEDENAEATLIADTIRRIKLHESRSYDDFGVLLRTNFLSRPLEEAFLAANIPYRVSGGQSFFARKEIKDIISYLRIIANPRDDVNLLRIINTPRRGIGKTTIAGITDVARKNRSSLWDALERIRYAPDSLFQDVGKQELHDFMLLIESFRETMLGSRRNLAEQVKQLVSAVDYWTYLVGEHRNEEKTARRKYANIDYFIQMIDLWEHDPDTPEPNLFAYLNRISLITSDSRDDEYGKGRVNISTIHAAKGLEFPVVFIAGVEDGIIPHSRSLEEGSLEEERRLFYVAITRARDKLFISSCQARRHQQQTLTCVESPFLFEIPPHVMDIHDPRGKGSEPETAEETERNAQKCFALLKSRFQRVPL